MLNAETPVAPKRDENWLACDVAVSQIAKLPLRHPKAYGSNAILRQASGGGMVAGAESAEISGVLRGIFSSIFKDRRDLPGSVDLSSSSNFHSHNSP